MRVALFREVPEALLNFYDLFERKEEQISLALLLRKNTGETIQQPFFSKKKKDIIGKMFGVLLTLQKMKTKPQSKSDLNQTVL